MTRALVVDLKNEGQDFEWYPTTSEMIETVTRKISSLFDSSFSLLDIGAGDGRVIDMIDKAHRKASKDSCRGVSSKYAVEKSQLLIQAMPADVCIVGTDFLQQTLIDKKVDVIFCNPPYSEYEDWTNRIIRECNCGHVFMIIPERWKKSKTIQDSIERRKAKSSVLASTDFLNAERAARAKVDIIHFDLTNKSASYYEDTKGASVDPFDVWFADYFKISIDDKKKDEDERAHSEKATLKCMADSIVKGKNQIKTCQY